MNESMYGILWDGLICNGAMEGWLEVSSDDSNCSL